MMMKLLRIECSECHFFYETDDSQSDFDDWIDDKICCPKCKKNVINRLKGAE